MWRDSSSPDYAVVSGKNDNVHVVQSLYHSLYRCYAYVEAEEIFIFRHPRRVAKADLSPS